MSENVYNSALTGPQLDEALQTAAQLVVSGLSVERGGTGAKTAEQARSNLGAAPAGYGLGGVPTKQLTLAQLDNTFESGWYLLVAPGTTINGLYFNYACVFVHGMEKGTCVQEVRPFVQNAVLRRYAYNNAWNEWECENPPMVVGVEYRTTERWQGKAVYTKTVSLGTVAAGENTISLGIPGITAMCGLELTDSNNFCVTGHPNILNAWASLAAVVVNAKWAQGLYATLKYTKG